MNKQYEVFKHDHTAGGKKYPA